MRNIVASSLLFCLTFCSVSQAQITANWTHVGPIAFPINASGQINGIGRVCQIRFHPSDPQKMYAVSASGGLWISTNAGQSWKVTGSDNLPITGCASVCVDYTDDRILYLGTGDPNYYSTWYGIWKSTDGGASWAMSNGGIGYAMAVDIVMDPRDHTTLVAATNTGIWKSVDGGVTWINKLSDADFTEMKSRPGAGSRVLYACTLNNFYVSNDWGETWTKITSGLYYPGSATSGQGLRIAVSEADTNVVYVGMIANRGTIFKSIDGGQSFLAVKDNANQSLVGYDENSSGQGNYNFDMTCDPDNANIVYVVAHCVWKSTDGGITWTRLTAWYFQLHTDMHNIVFSPFDHSKMYEANDGGVWEGEGGINWQPQSDGIEATEIYHAATSPTQRNMMSIGTQDNGELFYQDSTWYTNRGGDWGSKAKFDFSPNSSTAYYYENGFRRDVTQNHEENLDLPFTGGFNEMALYARDQNLAFVAKNDVWITTDLLESPPTWTKITSINKPIHAVAVSPSDPKTLYVVTGNSKIYRSDNALDATPLFVSFSVPGSTGVIASLAVAKNLPGVVYLSCGTKVYRSIDQGATWTNITGALIKSNVLDLISDDYTTDGSLFAATAYGVYYRNDTMNDWIKYSQGLPSVAQITDMMAYNTGASDRVLRVSSYGRGAWESPINTTITVNVGDERPDAINFSFDVFPNPSRGLFEVHYRGEHHGELLLQVTDEAGTVLREERFTGDEHFVDCRSLAKGMYFLHLTGEHLNATKSIFIR